MPIDDALVSELSKKMGYSTETILKALKEPSNNQFKVAYQLVLDNKTLFKDTEHNNIPSFLATSPPPWNTSLNTDDISHEDESSISVLSSSLPKAEPIGRERSSSIASLRADLPIIYATGTPPPGAMAPPSRSTQPRHLSINTATKKPHKSRSKWHFGIRSRCPAWEVMLEIYRSLQNVGMEWRTVDPYHLRCRYKYVELGLVVKFDLQLYKLENNSYLVDFKNAGTKRLDADGKEIKKAPQGPFWQLDEEDALAEHMQSVYPFLDVCSKLITDIV
ncbi:Putative CAMK/CAMKL/AMPK protein kinase [Rhizopus microsporus]|nr:Putative CAMK/CAMKL/AMPK protein kinase [Rhizopus microsporus]